MASVRSRCRWYGATPAVAVLAAALVGGACGGGTEPETPSLSGTYDLYEVNGTPLPYTLPPVFGWFERQIVAGEIEFRGRGRLLDQLSFQDVVSGAPVTDAQTDTLVEPYALVGTQLLVERTTASGTATYTDTGTVQGALISLKVRDIGVVLPSINLRLTYRKR